MFCVVVVVLLLTVLSCVVVALFGVSFPCVPVHYLCSCASPVNGTCVVRLE